MPLIDSVHLNDDMLKTHLNIIYENKKFYPWAKKIPDSLIFRYIILYRSSQEPFTEYAKIYNDSIKTLLKDVKDMREAVLKINEYLAARFGYISTKPWDQSIIGSLNRGYGRCEEMAALLILFARMTWIPARQVYTPYWPFTNSNHAWAEVWVDGKWHCLDGTGMTELDHTWFKRQTLRTALVKTITWGQVKPAYYTDKKFTILNVIENYANARKLNINIDNPLNDTMPVGLYVFNFASLRSVGRKPTIKGKVSYKVGPCDLFVQAGNDSMIGFNIYRMDKPEDISLKLIPIKEFKETTFVLHVKAPQNLEFSETNYKPSDTIVFHRKLRKVKYTIDEEIASSLLYKEDSILITEIKRWYTVRKPFLDFFLSLKEKDKKNFITYTKTIFKKDLFEYDTETIKKGFEAFKIIRTRFTSLALPDSLFKMYVAPSRIYYEEVGEWKPYLLTIIQSNKGKNYIDILSQLMKEIKIEPDYDYFGGMMNPEEVYKAKRASEIERLCFGVGVLRTMGIPARLRWDKKAIEYYNSKDNIWTSVFELKEEEASKKDDKNVTIAIYPAREKDFYKRFTINEYRGSFISIEPPFEEKEDTMFFTLPSKTYYLIYGDRDANGSSVVTIKPIEAKDSMYIQLKTGKMPPYTIRNLTLNQIKKDVTPAYIKSNTLILYLNGKEPSLSTLKALRIHKDLNVIIYYNDGEKDIKDVIKATGLKARIIKKKLSFIKRYPGIILIKNNEIKLFWEGLMLHIDDVISNYLAN